MSLARFIAAGLGALVLWLAMAGVVGAAEATPLKLGTLPPAAMKLLLPYESPNKHLGVATCSSSVCHGSVKSKNSYNVLLNEYVVWSHDDSHAKAYNVLKSERSRAIAAKLGLPNAYDAKICLDCHA